MLTYINQFLDRTTMYKVVSYSLFLLIAEAFVFSAIGLSSYSILALFLSLLIIGAVSLATHFIFQKIYRAPANIESTYISIFIAFLILAPVVTKEDALWTACAAFVMIASKYVVAHRYRHFFNPVAFGIFVIGVMGATSVSWWVGGMYFLPSVLLVAFFVITKLKRHVLFFGYLAASVVTVSVFTTINGGNITEAVIQHFLSWPLIFLGVFMLTEPLTTPPTKKLQGIYGAIVGVLSSFPFAFPPIYATPELALLLGNIFSYVVSTKSRVFLSLVEKKEIAKDTFEFTFRPAEKMSYTSGQYMEWTFPHASPDVRGIRRYFTIASSPLEDVVRLGVKRAEKGSTFKNALFSLDEGKGLLVTSVMGDFLLPEDTGKKLVFIAGGIGITPFVSMLRTLVLKNEKRTVTLFYANKKEEEIAYKDVLENAEKESSLKAVHILSDTQALPQGWSGETGFITKEMLEKHVADIIGSRYYISGPPMMVSSYEKLLKDIGVPSSDIVTDFFPGFN